MSSRGAEPSPASGRPRVSQPADRHEHDAERMASHVLGRQREARSDSGAPGFTSAGVRPSSGAGRPLDAATRAFFEPRFREDFSQVRVHTDSAAQRSADALAARAYTAGQDIVFAKGAFAPQTAAGRGLLAHELSHVVQQRSAGLRIDRYVETTDPNTRLGQALDTAGHLGRRRSATETVIDGGIEALCLLQVDQPMRTLTRQWMSATCAGRGNVGPLHARDWDAFGHCWVACEGSRRCGNFAAAEIGTARELLREAGYGGPHDSFRQDVANQATGRELAFTPGRCYTLCDDAYRAGGLDLTAPVRTCLDCAHPSAGANAANCGA